MSARSRTYRLRARTGSTTRGSGYGSTARAIRASLGVDYAASKEVGALLIPQGGRFHVQRLVPDGPAAAYGLREGDAIVAASGDAPPRLEEVLARIKARRDLTVARRRGDVWVDLVLPDGTRSTPEPE